MSKKLKDRPERDRPEPPDTPFLCAGCRFGLILLQKVPLHDRYDRKEEPWKSKEAFEWEWEARCNNPRIAGKYPETFCSPVVDCEGFEARDTADEDDRDASPPDAR